ncbi:hypothetical protein ACVWZ8_004527 [Arthrobacter sp. UYCu723]
MTRWLLRLEEWMPYPSHSMQYACELGPVPDKETGVAGELVRGLGDDLNDELLGDDFFPGG